MTVTKMEQHAAEALLELHFGINRPRPSSDRVKVEIEGAATLLLSCRSAPDADADPSTEAASSPATPCCSPTPCRVGSPDDNSKSEFSARARRDEREAQKSHFHELGSLYNPIDLSRKETCERGTQTDDDGLNHAIRTPGHKCEKDTVIAKLYAKIDSLEKQLKAYQRNELTPPISELGPEVATDSLMIQHNSQKVHKRTLSASKTVNASVMDSDDEWSPEKHDSKKQIIQATPKPSDMIPIGDGHASVPARLLKQIDWSSYTGATRKLLTAVFSRRELATHSLTGKPSPAFPGKPAKKRLNTDLVSDIVQTVVERCGVPESIVRTSITTKCADESKMYRSRQQKKKKKHQSYKPDQENVPPRRYEVSETSDDSN